jgi:LacI family transcriptional regulator
LPRDNRNGDGRRVTVADVAAHAGVSQATVSQVLGGSRPVAQETRSKVLASIAELGFRPNQLARALRHQRSHTVAIVVPNITHVVYPMVARGVSEVLRPLGYQVALYDTDGDPDTETQVLKTIADRMVDGAVLFGYEVNARDTEALTSVGIHIVNGGLDDALNREWDTVRVDQFAAFKSLTELAIGRCGPTIAYIGGPADEGSSRPREAGFRAGMASAGLTVDESYVTSSPYSWQGGRDALHEIFATGRRPRAVVCGNDMIAIGAMTAARDLGLDIPAGGALSRKENNHTALMSIPPLSTVEAYPFEQGRACARLLLERMSGEYDGPARHQTLSAELILRETL